MERSTAGSMMMLAGWLALAAQPAGAQNLPEPGPTPFLVAANGTVPARGFDLEWSQGEPFVGASDGASTTHGFQPLDVEQAPTAMVPAVSGLSLIVVDRASLAYQLRFDEARMRYLVKLFGDNGRLLRIYVVYPEQTELSIPYAKLPGGPAFLSVHNEAGNPLQSFKLSFAEETWSKGGENSRLSDSRLKSR